MQVRDVLAEIMAQLRARGLISAVLDGLSDDAIWSLDQMYQATALPAWMGAAVGAQLARRAGEDRHEGATECLARSHGRTGR
jgi:cytochrome c553